MEGGGGGGGRLRYEYIIYLRFQGMLAHAPMGWLHPVLHRDPPCLSPSLHPSRLVALAVTEPSPVCANYTCANQPASNEAGPVSVAPPASVAERVQPLLFSLAGAWVERGPFPVLLLCLITRRR